MNNIEIINGIMEPVFDENVYEYTVTVSKDVISLIFDYNWQLCCLPQPLTIHYYSFTN